MKIVLASASPRRRDLLSPFYSLKILPSHADESQKESENPRAYVQRIARTKWADVSQKLDSNTVVVAADTIVVLGQKILGKAAHAKEAERTLRALSGKTHRVLTAVVVGRVGGMLRQSLQSSEIRFRKLEAHEICDYIRSNEWRGKAGAYAIQGKALKFCASLKGSLTNVVGLPLEETLKLIEQSRAR
jgi:septum formation protein